MAAIAIAIGWLIIYAVILAGMIYLVLYGIKTFIYPQLPPKLEQGIWFIFVVLMFIFAIGALSTGSVPHPFR